MMDLENGVFLEQVEDLAAQRRWPDLRDMLTLLEPADIAAVLAELSQDRLPVLYRLLPKELAAEVFVEMEPEEQEVLIKSFSDTELREVLEELYVDDTVDLIEEMPATVVKRILRHTDPETRRSVNEILQYPEDSAGSIMTTEFVDLKRDMTVSDAIKRIRRTGSDKETINICYVTDTGRHLLGLVSIRTLLLADANLTNVSPSLATDYTVSEDGLTYTFTMKEGVKWSDGEPLTAADVAFSIKTNLKVASGNAIFTNAFTNIVGAEAWRDGSASDLEGVKVEGNVVTITLSSPYGAFIPVIAQFCILPEHAMKDLDPLEIHNSEYWANPVTSGAFKLGELSVGNYYTLVPNEHYEGTPWKITQIINYYVPDLLVAAQAGNTYMLNTNAPEIISELGKLDFMTMYPVDILFYRYFICNMKGVDGNENPVMQDKRVREAILYAIDRETIAEQLYPGLAHVLHSGVPNDYAEYNGTAYEYNPEKAKQLLQEANYDFNHTFRILYYYSDQNSIDFMDTIAYYLREVGMKVETVHSQQGTVDLFQTRNYDVGYKGLSAFNIAEWYGEYSSGNANFRNIFGGDTKFDEKAEAIAAEADPAKRSAILKELQTLEQDNLYKLPLYTIGNNIFINTNCVKLPDGVTFGNPWYLYDMDLANWEIIG